MLKQKLAAETEANVRRELARKGFCGETGWSDEEAICGPIEHKKDAAKQEAEAEAKAARKFRLPLLPRDPRRPRPTKKWKSLLKAAAKFCDESVESDYATMELDPPVEKDYAIKDGKEVSGVPLAELVPTVVLGPKGAMRSGNLPWHMTIEESFREVKRLVAGAIDLFVPDLEGAADGTNPMYMWPDACGWSVGAGVFQHGPRPKVEELLAYAADAERLEIDDDGELLDAWPPGFFEARHECGAGRPAARRLLRRQGQSIH